MSKPGLGGLAKIAAPAAVLLMSTLVAEARPLVWLAPLDKAITADGIGSSDYSRLFDDDAPWREVLSHVSVFKIYPYFLSRVSDDELRKMIVFLKARHIALALEARVLDRRAACGDDGGEATIDLIDKIKRAGGSLNYLAMDEPLHHWRLRNKCNATVDELAKDVEREVQRFRRVFPNLEVGDIEPIGQWKTAAGLMQATTDWLDAFKRADGRTLAFIHADVGWETSWVGVVLSLRREAARRGVRFGMIYNGNDLAKSDAEWSMEAASHAAMFENSGGDPDEVVFQSWVAHPSKVLPETSGETLTGIAKAYLDAATKKEGEHQ